MIITCPACETNYSVSDAALGGASGRRVRCASCGNVWHYYPATAAVQERRTEVAAEGEAKTNAGDDVKSLDDAAAKAEDEATARAEDAAAKASVASWSPPPPSLSAAFRVEPRFGAQPRLAETGIPTRPPTEIEVPGATRRRKARVQGIGLIALAIVLLMVLIGARDSIMRIWPTATPVYRTLRLAEPTGAGLKVTVTPNRTSDSLVIDGNIVNTAETLREVPRMRVALRDGNNNELESQVIDPPVQSLPARATAKFSMIFKHPSITATGVVVTFVSQ